MLHATNAERDRQALRLIADVARQDVRRPAGLAGDVYGKGVVAVRVGDSADAELCDADTGTAEGRTCLRRDLSGEDGRLR